MALLIRYPGIRRYSIVRRAQPAITGQAGLMSGDK
jgi:hypothetical protein